MAAQDDDNDSFEELTIGAYTSLADLDDCTPHRVVLNRLRLEVSAGFHPPKDCSGVFESCTCGKGRFAAKFGYNNDLMWIPNGPSPSFVPSGISISNNCIFTSPDGKYVLNKGFGNWLHVVTVDDEKTSFKEEKVQINRFGGFSLLHCSDKYFYIIGDSSVEYSRTMNWVNLVHYFHLIARLNMQNFSALRSIWIVLRTKKFLEASSVKEDIMAC